jgi:hypothetical protein
MLVVGTGEKQIEKISSLEFRFANSTPLKRVTCYADWNTAWIRTQYAVEYLFPHRKEELRVYAEHILRKFTATHASYHDRVILYDRAVRERLSSRLDLSFAHINMFSDLADMHTSAFGSAVVGSSVKLISSVGNANDQPRRQKSNEACRKYSAGSCQNTATSCRYRHVCAVCRQAGHVASSKDCTKRIKRD